MPATRIELIVPLGSEAPLGRGENYQVLPVRWQALPGVTGEGLLLLPDRKPVADVVALPDADQTPEMLAGLAPGTPPQRQFARRLAESGCRVVIPTLIDRDDAWSVSAAGQRKTNQPHREFIYRQAFEMGRHVIGYEVQKVLALVDCFRQESQSGNVGVYGYGEGGLIALYAAALDARINAACVSGYFNDRQSLWKEPIYRNVFGLLDRFGDAELASMIAPRGLIVENETAPQLDGPPAPRDGRGGAAPGELRVPGNTAVLAEIGRARSLTQELPPSWLRHTLPPQGDNYAGPPAVALLLKSLAPQAELAAATDPPELERNDVDPRQRSKRQFDELIDFTQGLLAESAYTRQAFWSRADRQSRSTDKWRESTQHYRDYFYNEVIGRFDMPLLPARPRTRQVYNEPRYTGYEVVLDVFPDVFAYGILLLPKDLKPCERRPVVVCQHGLEGRPQDVAEPGKDQPAYHRFAGRLAEEGFITYSPQNPYIFGDRFRSLQRKANPLGKTLFSIIVPQHQQTVDWLASLPMVDASRIAFYGLSYGGKTAMRVPPLVDRYCLSICSADFNEWIWKNTSYRSPYSYLPSGEYEIFEFDLGNTFNYAEMAGLIAPRPFMVERGHRDGVAPDETVAHEYAKVRLLYADLKIPERTEIEFFDGPHTIHGVGTFEFLRRHLDWPRR